MRPKPLLLVILAHVAVMGLLIGIERRYSQGRRTEGELVYVLPITPVHPPALAPQPQPRKPRRVDIPPTPAPMQPPQPNQLEPEPITPAAPPPIDWQREIERAVRESTRADEATSRYRSLDSDPTPLDLPQAADAPEQFYTLPNGDKVAKFKVGDRIVTCVSPQVALDEHFAVWAYFRPSRCSSRKPGSAFLTPPSSRSAMKPEE